MKKLIQKSPVIASLCIMVIFCVVIYAVNFLWLFPESFYSDVAYQIVIMLIPFLMVVLFGDVKIFAEGGFFRTLSAGAFLFFAQLILLLTNFRTVLEAPDTKWQSPKMIFMGILILFGVSFREESVFRGIVVNIISKKYAFDRKGILITVITSGAIFGVLHMTNVLSGVSLFGATVQSLAAVGIGAYWAAVYLRGGSIWSVILMHTITNAASMFEIFFTVTEGDAVEVINGFSLLNISPLFIFGSIALYLVREKKCHEIYARLNRLYQQEIAE